MLNQCDGCKIHAPMTERGHHNYPDGSFSACTKKDYQMTLDEAKAAARLHAETKCCTGGAVLMVLDALDEMLRLREQLRFLLDERDDRHHHHDLRDPE